MAIIRLVPDFTLIGEVSSPAEMAKKLHDADLFDRIKE